MTIIVSISRQEMELRDDSGQLERTYPVSTSRFGLGSVPDSNFTPLGRFRIVQKIGHGAPARTIFRSRRAVGLWDGGEAPEDYVLTRILWLDGMEEGNANTFSRYIYIHGTNQEESLGGIASHGCIRLSNTDAVDLFERVDLGTPVLIQEAPSAPPQELI